MHWDCLTLVVWHEQAIEESDVLIPKFVCDLCILFFFFKSAAHHLIKTTDVQINVKCSKTDPRKTTAVAAQEQVYYFKSTMQFISYASNVDFVVNWLL